MEKHRRRPDELGYRWVVLGASFLVRFLVFGSLFAVGVLYVAWLDEFHTSKGDTAWIGSIATGSCLLVGPAACAIMTRIGTRRTLVLGGVLMSSGMILSVLAPNIYYLFFTYGILAGCGGGIANLAAVVRIVDYFDKERAFAMGIGSSGVGLGAFGFNVLEQYLLNEYGWRGSLLIVGAICLNICVAGLLMIHPKHLLKSSKRAQGDQKTQPAGVELSELPEEKRGLMSPNELSQDSGIVEDSRTSHVRHMSESRDETHATHSQNHEIMNDEPDFKDHEHDQVISRDGEAHGEPSQTPDSFVSENGDSQDDELDVSGSREDETLLSKSRIAHEHSQQTHEHNEIKISTSETFQIKATGSTSPRDVQNKTPHPARRKSSIFQKFMYKMQFTDMTISLWRDPVFILLFVSDFLSWIVQFVPYVHLPERARILGIPPTKSALLVSSMGFAGAIGKLGFGTICTYLKFDTYKIFTVAQILFGLSTLFSPLCESFASLLFYAISFGFLSGAYALMMVIPADLLGFEKFSAAYGFLLAGEGVGVYLGPPIAGWISDASESYDNSFYCAGAVLLTSGLILLLRPVAEKLRDKKNSECSSC